jgi:hypothetical protein
MIEGFTTSQRDAFARILDAIAGTEAAGDVIDGALYSMRRALGGPMDTRWHAARPRIREIVSIVAEDGLPEPRDLDVALDAIQAALLSAPSAADKWATPWAATVEKAKALGWAFGSPRRSNLSEWYKKVDGILHTNGGELWKTEVEGRG